jgi:hypothetical protein
LFATASLVPLWDTVCGLSKFKFRVWDAYRERLIMVFSVFVIVVVILVAVIFLFRVGDARNYFLVADL